MHDPEPADPPDLTPTEVLYAFAGYLTTLPVTVRVGATEWASPMVDLLKAFQAAYGFAEPRENFHSRLRKVPPPRWSHGGRVYQGEVVSHYDRDRGEPK